MFQSCLMTCGAPLGYQSAFFFHITDCRLCPESGHADTVRAPGVFCTAALRTKPWAEAAAWRLNQGDPYPTKILW